MTARPRQPRTASTGPIRLALAVLTLSGSLSAAREARADEPPTFADRSDDDVRDTDRAFVLLLNPLATTTGIYGGEADFVLGRFAALALEGDIYERGGSAATAFGVGLLAYPQGSALHGFYLEPRVVYARPLGEGLAQIDWGADVLGLSATAGWQWTWDYGLTVRIGGGAMFLIGGARSEPGSPLALGPRPVLDGSVGWAF